MDTPDPLTFVVHLKSPQSGFLDYQCSPYGPKFVSPAIGQAHAGTDMAQGWLQTHDAGTGPYTLTSLISGQSYDLAAYPSYWGAKPYFTTVDLPVQTDVSTEQLLFNKGQLAAILHDLPQSAVQSYLSAKNIKSYSLPTMMSDYLYVNPSTSFLTTAREIDG